MLMFMSKENHFSLQRCMVVIGVFGVITIISYFNELAKAGLLSGHGLKPVRQHVKGERILQRNARYDVDLSHVKKFLEEESPHHRGKINLALHIGNNGSYEKINASEVTVYQHLNVLHNFFFELNRTLWSEERGGGGGEGMVTTTAVPEDQDGIQGVKEARIGMGMVTTPVTPMSVLRFVDLDDKGENSVNDGNNGKDGNIGNNGNDRNVNDLNGNNIDGNNGNNENLENNRNNQKNPGNNGNNTTTIDTTSALSSAYISATRVLVYQHDWGGYACRDCLRTLATRSGVPLPPHPLSAAARPDWDRLPHRRRRRFKVLYGSLSFGVCEKLARPCNYAVIMPHPITRSLQVYQHCKANHTAATTSEFCHFDKIPNFANVTLPQFLRLQGSGFFKKLLYYSRHCRLVGDDEVCLKDAAFSFSARDREIHLKHILDNLHKWFSVVGLVERYTDSMELFEYVYKDNFTGCPGPEFEFGAKFGYRDGEYMALRKQIESNSQVMKYLHADIAIYNRFEEIFQQQWEVYQRIRAVEKTTPTLRPTTVPQKPVVKVTQKPDKPIVVESKEQEEIHQKINTMVVESKVQDKLHRSKKPDTIVKEPKEQDKHHHSDTNKPRQKYHSMPCKNCTSPNVSPPSKDKHRTTKKYRRKKDYHGHTKTHHKGKEIEKGDTIVH